MSEEAFEKAWQATKAPSPGALWNYAAMKTVALQMWHLALAETADAAIRDFALEVTEWAEKTFPGQTPASKASHLHDEAGELMEMPGDPEEMADVFILLCNLAQMHGYDLLEEARKKMAINRARTWGPPDERGVRKHVMPRVTPGMLEGELCARDGCQGVMGYRPVVNCSCHNNPPCSACTDNPLVCLTCGANPDEDIPA